VKNWWASDTSLKDNAMEASDATDSFVRNHAGVSDQVHLVLMDIRLARGTDGIQAAEEIRTRFDIASLYLSAHTDAATLNRAQATQPLGFIAKPYTHAQLEAALRAAVAVLRGGPVQ
jgi:DNA-binding NarL/FixJ family response regulator